MLSAVSKLKFGYVTSSSNISSKWRDDNNHYREKLNIITGIENVEPATQRAGIADTPPYKSDERLAKIKVQQCALKQTRDIYAYGSLSLINVKVRASERV